MAGWMNYIRFGVDQDKDIKIINSIPFELAVEPVPCMQELFRRAINFPLVKWIDYSQWRSVTIIYVIVVEACMVESDGPNTRGRGGLKQTWFSIIYFFIILRKSCKECPIAAVSPA